MKRHGGSRAAKSNHARELLAFRQVRVLISQVVSRVPQYRFPIFLIQLAAKFPRRPHPQRPRFDNGLFWYQSPRCDYRSRSNMRAIQNDRSHSDEATVLDGAAMQCDRMSDRDILAQEDAVPLLHSVQHAAVLHV